MLEEHEDVEGKPPNSPEIYQQTKFMAWFEKAFPWLLVSGATLGLILMIVIPNIVFQEKSGDQLKAQSDLRLALLYTTGGVIAALGLLETYRKNTNDRTKANADIKAALKSQDHQTKVLKEQIRQFDENAFKERKAERRERYTKAVEQLGDEKAPIRMGGVYTLVGLVDEWLEEKNLDYSERLKEGQVIINNLCAYIRSPFTLASHYDELSKDSPTASYKDREQEFYTDKATLDSEADVRLGIIKEIHDRLQGSGKNTPGTWSEFEYDFSGSTFFYPIDLTNSYYAKPINFSDSTYKGWANFSGSTYQGWANFRGSTYQDEADFRSSTYQDEADFRSSTYQWANFSDSTYQEGADFSGSTYQGWANFRSSTYQEGADFSRSTYQWADFTDSTYQWAYFTDSTYRGWAYFRSSTYQEGADFSRSTYQWADFTDSTYQWAYFTDSTYQGWAYFRSSTYQGEAYFSRSTYQEGADFSRSTYKDVTDFSGSIFYQKVYFGADGDNSSFSRFTDCAPQFYDETNRINTLFGSPDNNFTVENGRGYPIYRNFEGLPLGCKFLTSEQKEYLEGKFQEIEKINNELLKVKDPKENTKLLDTLGSFEEELYEWQEEATTVKVEDVAAEDTES